MIHIESTCFPESLSHSYTWESSKRHHYLKIFISALPNVFLSCSFHSTIVHVGRVEAVMWISIAGVYFCKENLLLTHLRSMDSTEFHIIMKSVPTA